MTDTTEYGLIWKQCTSDNDLAERFYVPDYKGYLPFFLTGKDYILFKSHEDVVLKEEQLLKGILLGLFELDNSSSFKIEPLNRDTLLYLLDVLGNGFQFDNPEKMILDVAYSIRESNGGSVSSKVLTVGMSLIPESSKIKSDLICDFWAIIKNKYRDDHLFNDILELIDEIDFDNIIPEAKEQICFYGFCASLFLNRSKEMSIFMSDYVSPYVSSDKLKIMIKNMLENPNYYSIEELQSI